MLTNFELLEDFIVTLCRELALVAHILETSVGITKGLVNVKNVNVFINDIQFGELSATLLKIIKVKFMIFFLCNAVLKGKYGLEKVSLNYDNFSPRIRK